MPTVIPVTTPVHAFTVATAGVALTHVPPVVVFVSVDVVPVQTTNEPPMADGVATMVSYITAVQPDDTVYVTAAIPADRPSTLPPDTLATEVGEIDQVPPVGETTCVMVPPTYTLLGPDVPMLAPVSTVMGIVVKAELGNV